MSTEPNRKPAIQGALAGAAFAALLLAGGGTFALWSDQATVTGGTITAGDLRVAPVGDGDLTWYETHDLDRTAALDLATFRIVPGDSITATQDLAVALSGDNLHAQLSVDGAGSGALLGDPDGVQLTFSVLDQAGAPLVSNVPFGELAQFTLGATAGGGVDFVAPPTLPAAPNLKVAITASFPDTAANRDFTNMSAILDSLHVNLQQVPA
jgi:alternate signal-mediated exported protein